MMGDKIAKRSSLGNMVRRRLSDITNSLPQPANLEKIAPDSASAKEYVEHLVKEKMALVKHIQEKNKIIELTGIEIQNLRSCLQKMQLQNRSLAQLNSHMLAELNMGKDRLKALQHELSCKEALLKSKDLELKGREKIDLHTNELQEDEMKARGPAHGKDNEPCKISRRRRPSRSRSLSGPVVSQLHVEKEAVGSKRRYVRRQSASSRTIHQEPSESLFEIDDAKFLDLKPSNASSTKKEVTESNYGSKFYEEESRRASVGGRPIRKVVEKVQSYKEIPLNVKMRRSQ